MGLSETPLHFILCTKGIQWTDTEATHPITSGREGIEREGYELKNNSTFMQMRQ